MGLTLIVYGSEYSVDLSSRSSAPSQLPRWSGPWELTEYQQEEERL